MLLWLAVAGEPELVAIQSVPVLYRNLPPTLLLLSDAPDQVRAELRGPSGRLTRAALSDAFAQLDLAGVVIPGDQTFTLSAADFSLPQGVRFVRCGALAGAPALRSHLVESGAGRAPVEGAPSRRLYSHGGIRRAADFAAFRVRRPASAPFVPPRPTRWI